MKKLNTYFLITLFVLFVSTLDAQKKPLSHDDIESWKRISERVISDDGLWIAYKTEPWRGDSRIYLYNKDGDKVFESECGTDIKITDDSGFLIFTMLPGYEHVKELKLRKTKEEDMPGNVLGIYNIESGTLDSLRDFKNYKIPEEWAAYIAYQMNPAEKDDKEKEDNETDGGEEEKKAKEESGKNGFTLNLRNLDNGQLQTWPFVTEYNFAGKGRKLVFVSTGDDNDFKAGIYFYDIDNDRLREVMTGKNECKQLALHEDGEMLVFLAKDSEKKDSDYSVYIWSGDRAEEVVNNANPAIPESFRISENGRLSFSDNGERVFFGTAPERPERDTTILDEEYPDVDVWHGTEGSLHTIQVINKDREMKKTYLAMYDMETGRVQQIETGQIPDSRLLEKGNSDYVLLFSNKPYELQSMWEGSPDHYDVYLLSLLSGERKMIKKDVRARVEPSPGGNYLVWFNYPDYSYYSYNIETGKECRITEPDVIRAEDELNDVPNYAYPYGSGGWLTDDEAVLIYDRYDIWKVDPDNDYEPVKMTVSGREDMITYRLISFDRDKDFIDVKKTQYLEGTNEVSRESGYYRWGLKRASEPELLMGGNYSLSRPVKADDAETIVYTKETFSEFPDLLVTDLKFRNSTMISNANPQQEDFHWGTAELYSWTSLDGRKLEGLLYKPENFDPSKKYPMIVNFYEKSSSELYSHRTPELHRSTIDYHYYTSNGYVIFNPDVYYEDGYPGESAYNCVMPGVTALVGEGFIDPERIGAQGHSWGGYQVAYLATRTDMFAAIESGAPVVNMFSAYGGIRWWTGLNRAFQYEHTQSRIGGSIWEAPLRYLENSPLFTMDKVTTPILIMHNDQDGHVPWYQGIEYFIALRRLQKPVWMLNYTGEPHWPQNLKNKKDFQIRLAQFFNHYLKGEPMPKWMKEGIPAVDKDHDLGYELIR
ncbi:MAG: prolyl oligopeptidase family serine peptidase [Bacteroidales bacterium]|nr:prolyl oligopeptidase family serine peptidase [Bacteroidales bacterium]